MDGRLQLLHYLNWTSRSNSCQRLRTSHRTYSMAHNRDKLYTSTRDQILARCSLWDGVCFCKPELARSGGKGHPSRFLSKEDMTSRCLPCKSISSVDVYGPRRKKDDEHWMPDDRPVTAGSGKANPCTTMWSKIDRKRDSLINASPYTTPLGTETTKSP